MLVRVSRPRYKRHFSGLFLPQQGIVPMFFSGAGRQPISASLVLFLANEVWITCLSSSCIQPSIANSKIRQFNPIFPLINFPIYRESYLSLRSLGGLHKIFSSRRRSRALHGPFLEICTVEKCLRTRFTPNQNLLMPDG